MRSRRCALMRRLRLVSRSFVGCLRRRSGRDSIIRALNRSWSPFPRVNLTLCAQVGSALLVCFSPTITYTILTDHSSAGTARPSAPHSPPPSESATSRSWSHGSRIPQLKYTSHRQTPRSTTAPSRFRSTRAYTLMPHTRSSFSTVSDLPF
jgi:hypothetical protein